MPDRNTADSCFEWVPTDDKTRIFPIDYTLKELSEVSGVDRRKYNGALIETPIFRDMLSRLLVSDDSMDKATLEKIVKGRYPLPLEAGLFLAEMVKLANKDKYYLSIVLNECEIPLDKQQEFVRQLFHNLCDDISNGENTPEINFYRHILMADQDFAETILAALWESQMTSRIKRLKRYAKRAPVALQMKILKDCFSAIDCAAFELAYNEVYGPPIPPIQPEKLQTILKKLLSDRQENKKQPGDSVRATFFVDDIAIGDLRMSDMFKTLQYPPKDEQKELLKLTRNAYFENIIQKTAKTPFEDAHISMREYLDDSIAAEKSDLRELVKKQCVATCRARVIQWLQIKTTNTQPEQPANQFLYQFIEWTVINNLHSKIAVFSETLMLVSTTKQIETQLVQIKDSPDYMTKFLYGIGVCKQLEGFKNYFKEAWWFFNSNGQLASKETDPFSSLNVTAEDFSKGLQDAVTFFDLGDCLPFKYTAEDVKNMLELYIKSQYSIDPNLLYNCSANCVRPILYGVILMIFHLIARDVEEKLMQTLPFFIKMQSDDVKKK